MQQQSGAGRPSVSKVRPSVVSQLALPHYSLTNIEKRFLLLAERGDCASIQKFVRKLRNFKLVSLTAMVSREYSRYYLSQNYREIQR